MTKQIAIIDPFIKSPAIHCFNHLVDHLKIPCTYHQPSLFGMEGLIQNRDKISAYIVLGSASHVHENLPWHTPLKEFLLSELQKNKPTLGCCFGHQLICEGFGAKVEFLHPDEEKEMGKRNIKITQTKYGLNAGETFTLAVTHKQVVRGLPKDLLNIGHGIENDIVAHATLPFLGTQAHPEGSTHFCTHDITNLSSSDISLIQGDGMKLILRFFRHFQIV